MAKKVERIRFRLVARHAQLIEVNAAVLPVPVAMVTGFVSCLAAPIALPG